MTTPEKKPAVCKRCEGPTRQCDTCGRAGCPHLVSPEAKGSDRDMCGGCRLAAHRTKKKAAAAAPPPPAAPPPKEGAP